MPDTATTALGEFPEDALFAGALRLRQPPKGHRAGTDAVLLAATTPLEAKVIADLGAATGVVGLRAAQINTQSEVTLFEREAQLAALARANATANLLADRVMVAELDVFRLGADQRFRERFDCVLTNPPFHEAGGVRVSPHAGRAAAHVFGEGETLDGWLRNAAAILKPGGLLLMIHRADAIGDVIAAGWKRLGDLTLRFIHPARDQPANRLLFCGRKGSQAPLTVLPALILNENGHFRSEIEALHRGEGRIDMRT